MRTRTAPPDALARRTALSAVALLGVAPDAPVQLFSDDFQGVCQGATVSRATPYRATGATHKVILFSPNDGKLYEDTSTLPND
jgi:hypothetical protein